MSKAHILKKFIHAIEKCNFDEAKKYLTDDFVMSGPTPKPVNANEYLDIHKKLSQGVPDFSFNLQNLSESGNTVNGTVQVSGTHTEDMPSVISGVPSVPATNKKLLNPKEDVAITFKGDKISKMTVEKVKDGGVLGFLKQMGVNVSTLMM